MNKSINGQGIFTSKNYVNMKILKATRDRLADFGKKSETYDDVLNRLLDECIDYKEREKAR